MLLPQKGHRRSRVLPGHLPGQQRRIGGRRREVELGRRADDEIGVREGESARLGDATRRDVGRDCLFGDQRLAQRSPIACPEVVRGCPRVVVERVVIPAVV